MDRARWSWLLRTHPGFAGGNLVATARRQHGFTIIEILVVIAVLAILAAMLFPVLVQAREAARRSVCQSNLRQIGMAFTQYVSDFDGAYPSTGNYNLWQGRYWRWSLQPYLAYGRWRNTNSPNPDFGALGSDRNVLWCPSDYTAEQVWEHTSYAYARCFYQAPEQIARMTGRLSAFTDPAPPVVQREAALAFPSQKVLVAEWLSNHEAPKNASWWSWEGGRNHLFADGHIRYLKARSILPATNGFPDVNVTVGGIGGRDIP
ncbi:MAG: DUF1559 domain-containing protein [Armatimonadetes bacterium]|nr:DUF1559 domain-containing protein [Armatimonadota bacterium]